MKNLKRWIAVILALVIVVGASTVFVDHKLKASETNGDTTAQEQQENAEEAKEPVEVVVPPLGESEPVSVPEEPVVEEPAAQEPVAEEPIVEEPVEEEPIVEEPAEEEPIVEEPVEEEPAEEIAVEKILVKELGFKVPSYIYSAGEGLTAELVIKVDNADGAMLDKFIVEITKTNSAETTVREVLKGMNVADGKLAAGEIAFVYQFNFVPFDGENEAASLKVVIKDSDEDETVITSATVTFAKETEEIINTEENNEEPAEEITEEPIEEGPIVEEPAEEEPAEEEPIVEEPAEEEPTEEEPTEEEPTEEEPVEEEPTEEEPVGPTFNVTYDKDPLTLADGDELTFIAVITGLEDIEYQIIWQVMDENGEWIEVGTGETYTITVTPESRGMFWKYIVEAI